MSAGRVVMRALQLLLLGAVVLAGVLLWRAAGVSSRQASAPPAPPLAIDGEVVARHLAGSLRFPTLSRGAGAPPDAAAFEGLHRYLEATYPRVHATLQREKVAGHSLLYSWPGRDTSLRPVLLMAHQDVVPIEAASEADWVYPPFAGEIADGFVWGRGAIDNKNDVVCILEAVEALLDEGFRPERSIYLGFGHDEEVGGDAGAAAVAALLDARGVTLECVLDEGGGSVVGALPWLSGPVAPIALAEKGSVSFDLVVEATGGHSSIPPRHTAPGILAAAVKRLEDHPMPGHLGEPREPSPVSRTDSEAFALIQRTVAEVFPAATLLPALSVGGTDARHFYGLSDSVYRLTPLVAQRTDLARAHGVNERAPVAALADAVRFYARLIRSSAARSGKGG